MTTEMVTLPRELVERMILELGNWHESLIANEAHYSATEVAVCGNRAWKLLREQYPLTKEINQ